MSTTSYFTETRETEDEAGVLWLMDDCLDPVPDNAERGLSWQETDLRELPEVQ